jgi:hypothetical protein
VSEIGGEVARGGMDGRSAEGGGGGKVPGSSGSLDGSSSSDGALGKWWAGI